MAAPHVAGVAPLMRYVYPALTPSQFDTLLTLGRLTDDIGTVGRDDATGYGLINARKAVDEALALANNTSSAPSGVVVASPASLSFGANTSSATISLKTTANTSEVVTSITSNSAAISVQPTAGVNAVSKLGNYVLTVDRNKLAVGTSYPTLTVTTSLRSFSVQLAVEKFALGVSQNASFGRVVVRINDAVTSTKIAQLSFYAQSGKYTWSIPGIPAGNVTIVAGTNADGDGYFCERGEACGQFPSQGQVIGVSGNVSGLNFTIVPTGTGSITSSSLNPALGGDDDSGIPVGAP